MAHMKAIYSWAFILAVIACHEILFTEGRQLKSIKKQGNNTGKHGSKTINSQKPPTRKESDVLVTSADDSPRVDHSVVRKKQTFPPPPNQSLGFSAVSEPIDDFRPTTPGFSPGIGHSYTDHNVEIQPNGVGNGPGVPHSISNNTDDFRPTGPGHSPGIGHSSQNKHAEPNA